MENNVRVIYEPHDLQSIQRYRDDTILRQLRPKTISADTLTRLPNYRISETLALYENGEIQATCEISYTADARIEARNDLYEIDRFDASHPKRVAVLSNLVVYPDTHSAFSRFLTHIHIRLLERNVEVTLVACADEAIEAFADLGFRHYRGRAYDNEMGWINPLVLFNNDKVHLARVGSALASMHLISHT